MAGEIEAYLNARFALEECRKEIETVADDIMRLAAAIKKDPARFAFSGTDVELPDGSFSGQYYPSSDWPLAVDIQKVLFKYHTIRKDLRANWAVIPPNLKSGLQPPPAGVLPPTRFDKADDE